MKQSIQFPRKHQLGAAMALALGLAVSSSAFAAGMPGAGTVTVGSVNGGVGTTLTGLGNNTTLTVTGPSVVQWGGTKAPADPSNAAGFNVWSGKVLNVTGAAAGAALLNVDASGNPSLIAGTINAAGANPVKMYFANANGITVTAGATIHAPNVYFMGANLASTSTAGGVVIANPAQTAFGANTTVNVGFAPGGTVNVAGTINNGTGKSAYIFVAGSGTVNIDATNFTYPAHYLDIFGGVGFGFKSGSTYPSAQFGNKTNGIPAVNAYSPTNVSVNNATPGWLYADGNVTYSGYSTYANTTPGWTGVLSNTGTLATPSTIAGNGLSYVNPWYNTPNPSGGWLQTPVGSINNSGLLQTVTSGLTTFSNGFTNTGTLNIGIGGGLVVNSKNGTINLGGTVRGSSTSPAISLASLTTATSGDINVTAPLTISGNSTAATGTFTANAKGNVSLGGVLSLTDTAATSNGIPDYQVLGNNITVTANQMVANANGTNTGQPLALLNVNNAGGTVTVGSNATVTAGDIRMGYSAVYAKLNRVNLVADGNLTATNTGQTTAGNAGNIDVYATNVSGSGAGTMTAQEFDFDYTGNIRKSLANLTNNYWSNGLVLTSAGANPTLNLWANGPAKQFTNLRVAGNITVNSDTPTGAFFKSPSLQGTGGAGDPNPNRMSQMMLMATGNMTLGGSSAGTLGTLGAGGGQFFFPGLSYFGTISSLANPNSIGAGSITAVGDVNNSVAIPLSGGQGLYFMSNNVNLGGSLYTNMNSYVNFANASQVAQYANQEYAVSYSSIYTNTLNMAPPAHPIGNVYTIPTFP